MKKQFFIANWKSHKTASEALSFLKEFAPLISEKEDQQIIICPPFDLLETCSTYIKTHHLPLALGAQNISPFPEGAYTGEVSARSLKDLVQYTIIGHSERRHYFHETDDMLKEKVQQALAANLTPIYCVSSESQPIPQGVTLAAFEPLDAIGSGKPENPETVEKVTRSIQEKNAVSYILYGGSVTATDVHQYTQLPSISGVLVGGASLDPTAFAQLIQHA